MKPDGKEYVTLTRPQEPSGANEAPRDFLNGQNGFVCFNFTELLRNGDFDVRRAAEDDPGLTLCEYGEKLLRLLDLAPEIETILNKFAVRDFNLRKNDYKKIDSMLALLEDLKCGKFVVELFFLKNANQKKANWDLAAAQSESVLESYRQFCKRILNAKQSRTDAVNGEAPHPYNNDMTLKRLLDEMEQSGENRKKVIMAVDDSPDILRAVFVVLNSRYKVVPVNDPKNFEKVLKHVKPDLFLLDYMMPELTGFDLVAVIRGLREHEKTPVIILTSESAIDKKSAAIMLGADDYVIKPITANELRDVVAKYLP
ncbi:MAG: response regulator [Defluviitaleaceae bacterium]|nr:response regulator [Defluviitaleaceae bacterium]